MATVDAVALEHVLSSLDLRIGAARRVELDAGTLAPLPAGAVTLIYVAEGGVYVLGDDVLVEGDAFLSLGRRPTVLETEHGASVMIADLQLSAVAMALTDLLPDVITVSGFAGLEPAAAALATNLGQPSGGRALPLRTGDPVICRMMMTTILLSVIRAWAENGCAPAGWPSRSNDPFLDRVVAAIHEQPGREWTVEMLAGVGAMSRSVFAERFRSAFGRSPASYVTEVRMDEAKRMLDAGRTVSATSRSLGYASDEGFSRAFRRATGVTPSAWRMTQPALISA